MLQGLGAGQGDAFAGEVFCTLEDVNKHKFCAEHGLVHVDLPVHEASCYQEFLNAVDALCIDHELIVFHVEHGEQAFGIDTAFGDSRIEGVAAQVVQAVHVEL